MCCNLSTLDVVLDSIACSSSWESSDVDSIGDNKVYCVAFYIYFMLKCKGHTEGKPYKHSKSVNKRIFLY